jgi:hypothetical protein
MSTLAARLRDTRLVEFSVRTSQWSANATLTFAHADGSIMRISLPDIKRLYLSCMTTLLDLMYHMLQWQMVTIKYIDHSIHFFFKEGEPSEQDNFVLIAGRIELGGFDLSS